MGFNSGFKGLRITQNRNTSCSQNTVVRIVTNVLKNDLNKKQSPPAFLKCKADMGDQLYLTDPTEKVPRFITTEAEVIFLNQKQPCETSSMCVNYRLLFFFFFFLVKDIEQNYFLFKRILRYKIPTYGTQTPKCDQLI